MREGTDAGTAGTSVSAVPAALPDTAAALGLTPDDLEEVPEPGGATLGLVAAVVPLVLGVAGATGSWRLGVRTLDNPGAGLWPFVISLALVLLGVALLVRARSDRSTERFTKGAWGVGIGAVSLVAYALLFERVGFEIPTVLVVIVWLKVIGSETWRSTLTIAGAAVAALYLIFIVALGVNLPHLIA